MTLRKLMDNAFDEVWFLVNTPDGEVHFFWNADYIGGYEPVMEELEPMLDCTFEEFSTAIRKDPEATDVRHASPVPVVWVDLDDTPSNRRKLKMNTKNKEK